ncbi:hypothetical protein [Enterovirga aerilata]|uniref:hypothetical protein n=1 Tax=Enterovirga aerilata TaxID=2730920 RepID=UPI001FEF6D32|nr:hypothetical protein [Enterovirga sp. DB1703]
MRHRISVRPALAALSALLLGACVERGDFGRVKRNSAWNDMLEATGSVAAAGRGEPVSPYDHTDDERELRDRAWRFLVPAHDLAWFERALGELAAKRILPPDAGAGDPAAYFGALQRDGALSPASRYRRLSEDAAADARLLPKLADVAARVFAADGVRMKTLGYAGRVSAADIAQAEARVAENRCLVAWVAWGLDRRLAEYRYALEHLVIETPQAQAVPAERSVAFLEAQRPALARLGVPPLASADCAGRGRVPAAVAVESAPSPPALVRKG